MATNECNCNNADGTQVRPIYYKDDLDFYMKLLDCDDENIGIPDFDWEARLWTSSRLNYVIVSSVGGVKTNWRDEGDGRIHVVVDNPGLMPGDVHIDFEALLPNETFADGTRKLVKPFTAPIRLTRDCAPCPSAMEIELMLPYVRGKALTFDDLTDAEKDAFAQQAADRVTIENLGVATDAEVDEAMGELLDTPPTAEKKAFHLDRRIRRGIMPAKARPGIVYYDYGYIKINPWRTDVSPQKEWDITAFEWFRDVMYIQIWSTIVKEGQVGTIANKDLNIREEAGRLILTLDDRLIQDGNAVYLLRLPYNDGLSEILGDNLLCPAGVMFINSHGSLARVPFDSIGCDTIHVEEYAHDFGEVELQKFLKNWKTLELSNGKFPSGYEVRSGGKARIKNTVFVAGG